jgi:hypothetical protein
MEKVYTISNEKNETRQQKIDNKPNRLMQTKRWKYKYLIGLEMVSMCYPDRNKKPKQNLQRTLLLMISAMTHFSV